MIFNTDGKSDAEKAEHLKKVENSWLGHELVEKSKAEVARNLLLSRMAPEFVAKMTELTLEEVERILKELSRENN